jgi:hypothetical protein
MQSGAEAGVNAMPVKQPELPGVRIMRHAITFLAGLFSGFFLAVFVMRGYVDGLAAKTAEVNRLQKQLDELRSQRGAPNQD